MEVKVTTFMCASIKEVGRVANFLLLLLNRYKTLLLEGEIGSGKTTLVQVLSKKLGNTQRIRSPSFNKLIVYPKILAHIDCYNITHSLIEYLDYVEDLFLFIEWASLCKVETFVDRWVKVVIEVGQNFRSYTVWTKVKIT